MADQAKPWIPGPPGGLHGPSIEGSGHILDPTVRREIREVVFLALQDAFRDLASAGAGMAAGGGRPPIEDLLPQPPTAVPEPPTPPTPPAPPANAAAAAQPPMAPGALGAPQVPGAQSSNQPPAQAPQGGRPYPNGDLDLSFVPANVAPPAFPARRGAARRFYFLEGRDQPHKGG